MRGQRALINLQLKVAALVEAVEVLSLVELEAVELAVVAVELLPVMVVTEGCLEAEALLEKVDTAAETAAVLPQQIWAIPVDWLFFAGLPATKRNY